MIDVASALFAEKGYEAVSVRDILNVVDGAPGMFYYYFKSKQDIYIAAMEQYITQRLERKCTIIEDETVSFDEKLPIFRSMIMWSSMTDRAMRRRRSAREMDIIC